MTELATNQRFRPLTASLGSLGRWEVGGCDLAELAATHGTPLYVMDEATLLASARSFIDCARAAYPGTSRILYASKALCNMAVNRILHEAGCWTEVVSGGELFTVVKAGVPPETIVFQGNNKSRDELRLALEEGVGRIIIDHAGEIELLEELGVDLESRIPVWVRIAPDVDVDTHPHIQTGHEETKFGIPRGEQLLDALKRIQQSSRLLFMGFHSHVGSQVFDIEPFLENIDVLVEQCCLARDLGLLVRELDVGGGLGIAYHDQHSPPSIGDWVRAIALRLRQATEAQGLLLPTLIFEPGRALVGTAGATLYTVGSRRVASGGKIIVSVDGGMADNPRVITYGAHHEPDPVILTERTETVTIVGKFCESGDVLVPETRMPRLVPGDVIAMWGTGAYTFSMASNYNRFARPAMVLVHAGRAEVISERETLADLVSRDRLPARLTQGRQP